MKVLLIHADRMGYGVRDPTPLAEELADKTPKEFKECLVAFCSVEKIDEGAEDDIANQASTEIAKVADEVKAERIVIYPYAHLAQELGSKQSAIAILDQISADLRAQGREVDRSPFGWYKRFEIACKGHPLSELSRRFVPTAGVAEEGGAAVGSTSPEITTAVEAEDQLESTWHVLLPDGTLLPADGYDMSGDPVLRNLYEYEMKGSRKVTGQAPHIKLMQDLELVDYEAGSDRGNFRWYPRGKLVKKQLEEHVTRMQLDYGAYEVETPIMYDYEHPALAKYLARFPARQYVVRSDEKDFFLRFAACFGQYLIAHDIPLTHRQLPLKLYELTHYSFRREQSGELSGLRRLRTFTMPDMHTIVRDVEQASVAFLEQVDLSLKWMDDIEIPYTVAIRFVKSFFEENRELANQIAAKYGRPILIELWQERFFYFVMKFEVSVADSSGKAVTLGTVQIDVENAERFDIRYADEQQEHHHPLILHTSVSGGIDRCLYAILEYQHDRMARGEKARLPFWLIPGQVRIIPLKPDFNEAAIALADSLPGRVEIDDRDQKIGKRIRAAEKEWVEYIIVYGPNEAESGEYKVRKRGVGDVPMTQESLAAEINERLAGFPTNRLSGARLLTERVRFR